MHMEHVVFEQESTQKITNQKACKDGVCQRDTGDNWKSSQWWKRKRFEQQNKEVSIGL